MPVPLAAPVIMGVGRYILTAGAKRAAKKYGDDVVKQVQKSAKFKKLEKQEMSDRVASAKAVKQGKPSEMTMNFKTKARRGDPYKLKERGEFMGEKLPDYEIAEIPLKFSKGGLLTDERAMYSEVREKKAIGGLVTKLFKLAKKKEPKKVKEQDIDKVLNSLSEEQMDKLSPIEIEQLLDMDLAKSGVDNIPTKSTKKDIDKILGGLTDKEMKNLSDIEIEQLLDMDLEKYGRKGKMNGGLLSDDRQTYGMGSIVKKLLKKKPSKQARDINYAEKEIDGLIDLRKKREAQLELDLEDADSRSQIDLLEQYNHDYDLITQNINRYIDQLEKLGVKPSKRNLDEKSRTSKAEGGMMPDEDMEDGYTRFIMEEALSEDEEDMLMSKLEQDEELQMLFDKVIDVAQEFAGSGPVDGPGSGVSDSIPARLSDGEFVFTAKAVEEIGEDTLMSMMKDAEATADERQGLAEGGMPEDNNVNVQADALLGMDMSPDPIQEAINENMIKYQPYVRS